MQLARHNAGVYGVSDRIEFIHADFMHLAGVLALPILLTCLSPFILRKHNSDLPLRDVAESMRADVVFLSPPWGGPGYKDVAVFDIETMMGGLNGADILRKALRVAPNVGFELMCGPRISTGCLLCC